MKEQKPKGDESTTTLSGAMDSQGAALRKMLEAADIDPDEITLPEGMEFPEYLIPTKVVEKDETEFVVRSENGSKFIKAVKGLFGKNGKE